MTDRTVSDDDPTDPEVHATDQVLRRAVDRARTATPSVDPGALVAAAQVRRDRVRRHRRRWITGTPIVVAAAVLVAVAVVAGHVGRPTNGAGQAAATKSATNGVPGGPSRAGPEIRGLTVVRVDPDQNLVDGQTVEVSVFTARLAVVSQCAVVRSADGDRFYACAQDPSDLSRGVTGRPSPGGSDGETTATDTLTLHQTLRGRLYLLTYPGGLPTGQRTGPGTVSCRSAVPPVVAPENAPPAGSTSAAPTQPVPGSTVPPGRYPAVRARCVVMASGVFWAVTGTPAVAPVFFGDDRPLTADAGRPAPTSPAPTPTTP